MINFLDLKKYNNKFSNQYHDALSRILESGQYLLGKETREFEVNFANYIGVRYCITVANGLDALYLSLLALQVSVDDEVIVPANTFIATWLAVSRVGARLIPVDVDPQTFNLDLEQLSAKITERTKVILPVHLYGSPVNISLIRKIIGDRKIYILEDAAQAHGATVENINTGALGDMAAFSFYPGKNLGALGDGGCITTNDKTLAEKCILLRNYGSIEKYNHEFKGINSRISEFDAAILKIKLLDLDLSNHRRSEIAKYYLDNIKNNQIISFQKIEPTCVSSWHLFVMRVRDREDFMEYMNRNEISVGIHYPIPPHKQNAYLNEFEGFVYPNAEKIHEEIVSIPIDPVLSDFEISRVVEVINSYQKKVI